MDDNLLFSIFIRLIKCIDNKDDSKHLYDSFKNIILDENKLNMMKNIAYNRSYSSKIGIKKFNKIVKIINNFEYRDEIREYINIFENKLNNVQKNVILRIMDVKKIKCNDTIDTSSYDRNDTTVVRKRCPHCNKMFNNVNNIIYIICGYNGRKMDNSGCGKDWCFRCGKKLCKSWFIDDLFKSVNRYHTIKCCMLHSELKGENFYESYCRCNSIHVDHNIKNHL